MSRAHFNSVFLSGRVTEAPAFSHVSHGKTILRFLLAVKRLSGVYDLLPVIFREETLIPFPLAEGKRIALEGEIRSFNNRSGKGPKLCLAVFARSFSEDAQEDANAVMLAGAVCKSPVFRETPLGREIADVMLAVNRRYRKSDYIPVILWGQNARCAASLPVGAYLAFEGRMQSRAYLKKIADGESESRVAYEVSAAHLLDGISDGAPPLPHPADAGEDGISEEKDPEK